MHDFKHLAALTAGELAFLTKEAPTVATLGGIGLGPDASEFETSVPLVDSAAVARQIIKAGAKARRGGDDTPPKLSTTAQAILRAGRVRRGESADG
jgi:hypothetical protein